MRPSSSISPARFSATALCGTSTSRSCGSSADAIGVHDLDAELRAAYRHGMGVAYPGHRVGAVVPALGPVPDGASSRWRSARRISSTRPRRMRPLRRQYAATVDGALGCGRIAWRRLHAVASAGLHVQIVSNIDDELLHPLARAAGLAGAFDAMTSSEEAGSCKPDPAIYRHGLGQGGRGCRAGALRRRPHRARRRRARCGRGCVLLGWCGRRSAGHAEGSPDSSSIA